MPSVYNMLFVFWYDFIYWSRTSYFNGLLTPTPAFTHMQVHIHPHPSYFDSYQWFLYMHGLSHLIINSHGAVLATRQTGEAGGITQQIGATYVPASTIEERTAQVNTTGMVYLKKGAASHLVLPSLRLSIVSFPASRGKKCKVHQIE